MHVYGNKKLYINICLSVYVFFSLENDTNKTTFISYINDTESHFDFCTCHYGEDGIKR